MDVWVGCVVLQLCCGCLGRGCGVTAVYGGVLCYSCVGGVWVGVWCYSCVGGVWVGDVVLLLGSLSVICN